VDHQQATLGSSGGLVLKKTNYGIVKTNSFSVDITGQDQTCLALFPTIARLNHSCQPNCNHYWSGSQFKGSHHVLTALHAIRSSILYVPPIPQQIQISVDQLPAVAVSSGHIVHEFCCNPDRTFEMLLIGFDVNIRSKKI
jgi:secreted trypsin-like serine protease